MQDANGETRLTREAIEAMTCAQLRAVLADHGEKTAGKKADLVERMCLFYGVDGSAAPPPPADDGLSPDEKHLQMAAAERRKRLELAELHRVLADKRCGNCATVGAWTIYDKERGRGRVRYVRCKACGAPDQAPVIVEESIDATQRN